MAYISSFARDTFSVEPFARGSFMPPPAAHFINRAGWLRAAVLGANDGIISTASLIVGVASAGGTRGEILTAAVAGWAAGAMAMAAGEYVSVSSQVDSEAADLERERHSLEDAPEVETLELALIYQRRGLAPALARQVAEQLMATDALNAHARDELGLSGGRSSSPILAAFASAISFSAGAATPTLVAYLVSREASGAAVPAAALAFLAALGALGAWLGGARIVKPTMRVAFWGVLAMAVTAAIGALVGKAV
jgi:VIT1/CCC1 family predicted Fe2+/Mn2+ transporter